jgi:hypothetical protein
MLRKRSREDFEMEDSAFDNENHRAIIKSKTISYNSLVQSKPEVEKPRINYLGLVNICRSCGRNSVQEVNSRCLICKERDQQTSYNPLLRGYHQTVEEVENNIRPPISSS